MTAQPALSYQGHYAGAVSRLASFVVDLVVSAGVFCVALAAISYGAQIITGNLVSWNHSTGVVAGLFAAWELAYFGFSWATNGRTPGMAVFGIRVVRTDGAVLEPRRATVRALVFPFSFLFCGLGFLGILVQREHRALHDLAAGSAVIYAWTALYQAPGGRRDRAAAGRGRAAGWRATTAKQAVLDFVHAVTAPDSPDFVAEPDRIAVFDNDGTLWTERPVYAQLAFALDRAAELGHDASLDLLAANGFSCWIFSGGGTDFMRAFASEVYGLPPYRVIGSVGATEFRDGPDGPELIKGHAIQVINDGPQKPSSIHVHVGQRPILAAGNTDGTSPCCSGPPPARTGPCSWS